jgi:hypothetical protein
MDREWSQSIFLYWFETGLACCGMTGRFDGAGGRGVLAGPERWGG